MVDNIKITLQDLPLISTAVYEQLDKNDSTELFFVTDNKQVAETVKENYSGSLGIYLRTLFKSFFGYNIFLVYTSNGRSLQLNKNQNISELKFISKPLKYKKAVTEMCSQIEKYKI